MSQYTVGGAAVNITSPVTLVLSGETLVINSSGEFKFLTKLNTGNSYTVSVLSHQSNVNCSLSNYSGVIHDSNITNVMLTSMSKL